MAAIAAAIGGILYGFFFVIVGNVGVAAALLMIGGLLSSFVLVALSSSVSDVNEPIARWALLIGVVGSMLSVTHGGYDLANVIHTPGASQGDFPNPADPRGLATFGLTGLAYLVLASLMNRSDKYPPNLGRVGQALGVITIIIFLGRLVILDPAHPVVRVALVLGVAANTVFFLWLGRHWLQRHGSANV